MTHMETRTYAAPAIRTKRNLPDPDKLLQRLHSKNPDASDVSLARKFLKAASPEELEAALVYYAHNRRIPIERYRRVMEPDIVTPAFTPEEYVARAEVRREERAEKTEARKVAARFLILDLVVSANGKTLRDCTGSEGKKLGGRIARIAAKAAPNQRIGDAVSDAEAAKIK